MKKTILTTALLLIGTHVKAQAQVQEQFPFIAPKCPISIAQPAGESGYYMGEDCKSVFVLPPRRGEVRIQTVQRLASMAMCPGLHAAYTESIKLEGLKADLIEKIAKEKYSERQLEKVERELKAIDQRLASMFATYDRVPAAQVWVSFGKTDMNEWVGKYLTANPNAGPDYQMRFYPAPIAQSVLSFRAVKDDGTHSKLSPVLSANIPGLRPIDADPSQLTGEAVVMNGGMSGDLRLSLAGACEYQNSPGAPVDDTPLLSNMVANLTYTVPLLTWAGYTANLDTNMAIETLVKSWQTRSKFSVKEASDLLAVGSASSAFTFNVTALESQNGTPYSNEDRNKFFYDIQSEVRTRLTANLLEQMAFAGFLQLSEPGKTAEAPEPGTIDQPHSVRSCRRSFFSKKCSTHTYVVKIPADSSADVVLSKINNTSFSNSETVNAREIMFRVHTSDFAPVGN